MEWTGLGFREAGETLQRGVPSVSYQQQLMRSMWGGEEEMKTSVRPSSHRRRKVDYYFFNNAESLGAQHPDLVGALGWRLGCSEFVY